MEEEINKYFIYSSSTLLPRFTVWGMRGYANGYDCFIIQVLMVKWNKKFEGHIISRKFDVGCFIYAVKQVTIDLLDVSIERMGNMLTIWGNRMTFIQTVMVNIYLR